MNKVDKTFWPQGVPIILAGTDRQTRNKKHLLEANKGYENKMSRLRDTAQIEVMRVSGGGVILDKTEAGRPLSGGDI